MTSVSDDALGALARSSVEPITAHQDAGGAYPASPTFRVYRYAWLRDGAFIADGMSRAGGSASSRARFFDWCAGVLNARASRIDRSSSDRGRRGLPAGEHLPTRFTLDGAEAGDEEWWDFQLDGYGTWIWALDAHVRRHGRPGSTWSRRRRVVARRYLGAFWDHAVLRLVGGARRRRPPVHARRHQRRAPGRRGSRCACRGIAVPGDGRGDLVVRPAQGRIRRAPRQDARRRPDVDASLVACAMPFGSCRPRTGRRGDLRGSCRRPRTRRRPPLSRGDTYFGGGRWVAARRSRRLARGATGRRDAARCAD